MTKDQIYRHTSKLYEKRMRTQFHEYCKEGIRPYMYDLARLADGDYVSQFTQWAWKIYKRGHVDAA